MGAESNAVVEHIREEREELGRDIRQLEAIVRDEPKRYLHQNLPRFLGIVFGALFLIGFAMTSRRTRRY